MISKNKTKIIKNKIKIIAMIGLNSLFGGWCSLSTICKAFSGKSYGQSSMPSDEAPLLQVELEDQSADIELEIKRSQEYIDLKAYMEREIPDADMQEMLRIGSAIEIVQSMEIEYLEKLGKHEGPGIGSLVDLANKAGKELNRLRTELRALNNKYPMLASKAELVSKVIVNRDTGNDCDERYYGRFVPVKMLMIRLGIWI